MWPLAAIAVLAACGTAPADTTATERRYEADATVLSDPKHGPQLCMMVAESFPPQCQGPDVVGWDWAAVRHTEERGTRWGLYHVVGTWDGERLTLTEPPRSPEPPASPPDDTPITTPCPEPEGGWRPADPAKVTQKTMDAALARAQSIPGYAGSSLDQSYLKEIEGYDPGDVRSVERYANDPQRVVLTLLFTGDPQVHEPAIREIWGGALCLAAAPRSQSDLWALQDRAFDEIEGAVSAGSNERTGQVEITVWVATPERQREVDEKYGEGRVLLTGFLTPVD
ncbi:hypothetical protein HerbRD11066_21530 [Herbidospora sp. RD11066]